MIGDEGRGRPRPSSFPVKDLRAGADREDMSTQISAPVKILALIGLLGSLAMGAWTFTAGRATTSASADVATSMHGDIAAAKSVAGKLDAHNKATTGVRTKAATAVASKPVAHKAKPARVKAPDGTPTTIASALRRHRVAVVLLVDPQSKIDSYSIGEARRGASKSHAGFLLVNVLRERQASAFAESYGVQSAPTLLFFARPGKLVQTLPGFADSETVAQAAVNAAHGISVPQG
jgi:type II secretory pathway pseudopilin PulG